MGTKVNLLNQRFGRLLVIEEVNSRGNGGSVKWKCRCDCGMIKEVLSNSLRAGLTTSCGCYNKERVIDAHTKHGHSPRSGKEGTYLSWDAMIQRCTNKNHDKYSFYGGSGVRVCDRWKNFDAFLIDMGVRPSKEFTIDRYPNASGNYEPGNCRWATIEQQCRNKSSNIWIEYNGVRMTVTDWAKVLNTRFSVIQRSMKRGKSFDEIYKFYKNK